VSQAAIFWLAYFPSSPFFFFCGPRLLKCRHTLKGSTSAAGATFSVAFLVLLFSPLPPFPSLFCVRFVEKEITPHVDTWEAAEELPLSLFPSLPPLPSPFSTST